MAGLCAGSQGGGQPPHHNPYHLAADCEADPIDDDVNLDGDGDDAERGPRRKGCSRAVGEKVLRRMSELGGPIPIYFDNDERFGTYRAIGVDSNLFISQLGIEVRLACDPARKAWLNVPQDQRATVQARMNNMFATPQNDHRVQLGIDSHAGTLYKQWKNRLSTHFKQNGGVQDLTRARLNLPTDGTDAAKWHAYIDFKCTPAQQRKSEQNSISRKSNPRPNCQGRSSLTQRREKNVKNPTVEPPTVTALDAWRTTKQRSDGSWAHPDYEPIYTQLQQGMEHLTQQYVSQCGDTSDAASPSTPKVIPRDQRSVIETVLRPRRDFTPGIGPKVTRRHSRIIGDSASSSSSRPPVSNYQQEEIQRLQQQLSQQQQYIQQQQEQLIFQEQQRVASETRMSYFANIVRQVPGVNFDESQLFPQHINLDDDEDENEDDDGDD